MKRLVAMQISVESRLNRTPDARILQTSKNRSMGLAMLLQDSGLGFRVVSSDFMAGCFEAWAVSFWGPGLMTHAWT